MRSRSALYPVARILLATIFIISGLAKLQGFQGVVELVAARGLPFPAVLLGISAGIEIVGGALIALGFFADVAAFALVAYLVPVTFLFHDFWSVEGSASQTQLIQFVKNLSLMGGLLTLALASPTSVSVDARRSRPVTRRA